MHGEGTCGIPWESESSHLKAWRFPRQGWEAAPWDRLLTRKAGGWSAQA